jgi:hypothetical protein
MTGRILGIALTINGKTAGGFTRTLLSVTLALAACSTVGGIDSADTGVSNDDTYAMLDGIWSGARATINAKKDPLTVTFNLPLSYNVACDAGGQRSYQGTLAGTDSSGSGSATLSMTATLTNCGFDNKVKITTITATGVLVTGTITITNDAYAATNLRMKGTNVTVNGVVCTGGVDVAIVATAPSAQVTSTGTACGRAGSVPLP